MMDMDPALIEAPYHHEVVIDGDIKAMAPLLALYDGMIACIEEEYEGEGKMRQNSVEPHLVLYSRSSCGYCKRVTNYLQQEHKTIPIKDVGRDSNAAKELVRIGGKRQVPCLVINGKALYESSAIIQWLSNHKGEY